MLRDSKTSFSGFSSHLFLLLSLLPPVTSPRLPILNFQIQWKNFIEFAFSRIIQRHTIRDWNFHFEKRENDLKTFENDDGSADDYKRREHHFRISDKWLPMNFWTSELANPKLIKFRRYEAAWKYEIIFWLKTESIFAAVKFSIIERQVLNQIF